ncbi:MAG: hypothetical protein GEU90_13255 [Gemmatimonas sp.]|nr:hypothetical protein [Gemmatimonas sp.]
MLTHGSHQAPVAAFAVLAAGLAACDLPTELPSWNTLWVVPGETMVLDVGQLLPPEVAVTSSAEHFALQLPPLASSRTLGEMCPPCGILSGQVVPKPEFSATTEASLDLPAELVSADLSGGELRITSTHTFDFDPLRPGDDANGHLVVSVSADGVELASDSIDGRSMAFPPGTTLRRTLELSPSEVSGPLRMAVRLYSPAGDPTSIHADQGFSIAAEPANFLLSEARIRVLNQDVASEMETLDLEDVDSPVFDRVEEGAVRLEIDNPWDLEGDFTLQITAPGVSLSKALTVPPGEAEVRVPFTGDELRSILGRSDVRLFMSGALMSPEMGALLRPSDQIVSRATLEAAIEIGGDPE